jgi:hypothetical protein
VHLTPLGAVHHRFPLNEVLPIWDPRCLAVVVSVKFSVNSSIPSSRTTGAPTPAGPYAGTRRHRRDAGPHGARLHAQAGAPSSLSTGWVRESVVHRRRPAGQFHQRSSAEPDRLPVGRHLRRPGPVRWRALHGLQLRQFTRAPHRSDPLAGGNPGQFALDAHRAAVPGEVRAGALHPHQREPRAGGWGLHHLRGSRRAALHRHQSRARPNRGGPLRPGSARRHSGGGW